VVHSKQRRGNEDEIKEEYMDELLDDAHMEEKAIREDRDETKKRQSGMTTNEAKLLKHILKTTGSTQPGSARLQ
jgi:hypothetical protein